MLVRSINPELFVYDACFIRCPATVNIDRNFMSATQSFSYSKFAHAILQGQLVVFPYHSLWQLTVNLYLLSTDR